MINPLFVLLLVSSLLLAVFAQSQTNANETIWSSVIVTRHGDRTPKIAPGTYSLTPNLTPLGAQQLASAGSFFRDRYIASSSTPSNANHGINGIAQYEINNDQIAALS